MTCVYSKQLDIMELGAQHSEAAGMDRCLHGSLGFLGRDGDRRAGNERSRRRIRMNSFTFGSYHPTTDCLYV